jgi:NADPH:quinone reductase-like Zn-dependent oxidoreductase
MDGYTIEEPTADYSGIVRTEREKPSPADDEVLVRLKACSLNYRDLAIANTDIVYPNATYPIVPLSDGAGDVVDAGDDVSRVSEGDRVATLLSPEWIDGTGTPQKWANQLGSTLDGVLTQYAAFPAESVTKLPAHLSYTEGATLPCAGVTAWRALIEEGSLSANETVLAIGTGGVSTFALQFAEMHGAKTIVTSASDEKLARARELGAWETINYRETPEWGNAVQEITQGVGVDHVVEVGGQGTLQQSLAAVSVNGQIHLIGVLTGQEGLVDPGPILHKAVSVEGIVGVGSRAMFERMNQAIAATEMTPVVDRVFGFDEVQAAYRHAEAGNHQGKVVISVE